MGAGVDDRAAAAADELAATLEDMNPPSGAVTLTRLTGEDPSAPLIKTAGDSYARFTTAPGPKSYLATARRLLKAYDLLLAYAILARRDRDGALLRELKPTLNQAFDGAGVPSVQWEPWLPSRPRSVEEIPPFTPENLALWRTVVADADHRALGGRTAAPPRKPDSAQRRDQLVLVGDQGTRRPILPFLLYFGNHGKIITVVKTADMSLRTEAGRVALIAYIIRIVAQTGPNGEFVDHTGNLGKNGEATPDQLARALLNSSTVSEGGGLARVFFAADMNEVNLIDLLKPGHSMQMVVDVHAIKVIENLTNVRKEFAIPTPPKTARGCAAIEWMREILAELPPDVKLLWIWRKIEDDRGVYEGGFIPGQKVPMHVFLPVEPNSEGYGREVRFLGASGVPGELLVVTEEGRILALNARLRNVQSYCTAVMSLAPWVAMFYMVAAVGGIILAGSLLPSVVGELLAGGSRLASAPGMLTGALRTTAIPRLVKWTDTLITARKWEAIVGAGVGVATIAFDVHSAGSLQAYVNKLKNPWEAAFLLLNLLSIKAAFKADDLARMVEESRVLGQAALQLQNEQKALAGAGAVANREGDAARAVEQARLPPPPRVQGGPAQADNARLIAPPPAGKTSGDRQIGNRLGTPEPAPTKQFGNKAANDNQLLPKEPPVPTNDIERMRLQKQAAAEKAEQARQPVVVDVAKKKAVGDREGGETVGTVRSGPTQGPGQGPGQGPPGGQPGSVTTAPAPGVAPSPNRMVALNGVPMAIAPIVPSRTELIRREALRKVREGLTQLANVTVALGQKVKGRFESLSGIEAVRRLFRNRISESPALLQHWPRQDAKAYVAEIQRILLDGARNDRKLLQDLHIAFQSNRADPESVGRLTAELLKRLPTAVRRQVKKTVLARWNTIRETFWTRVHDDVALRDELAKLGITFPGVGRAPVLRIGDKDLQITLDHISRKVENPLEAFNPANLRPMTPIDNSALKESLVWDIRKMTGLSFDEFNRLGGKMPPLTKKQADEVKKALDEMGKILDDIGVDGALISGTFAL